MVKVVVGHWRLVAGQDWETSIRKPGYCAIGGFCGINDNGNVPCSTNVAASPLDEDLKEVLALFCPLLWPEIEQAGAACCDTEDVLILQDSASRLSLFYANTASDILNQLSNFIASKSSWYVLRLLWTPFMYSAAKSRSNLNASLFSVLHAGQLVTGAYRWMSCMLQ